MARVKRGTTTHARHKKVLNLAKGYRGRNLLHHLVEIFHEQILQRKRADRCGPGQLNAGTPRISDCTRR